MIVSNTDLSDPRSFESQILFEDNHILIINKLPSQIIQGDKTGDVPLSEITKEYIKVRYCKPGEVFLGVVHRLDRPVSGVTIFARTSKALSRLNEMLKLRTIRKVYWAVVKNRPTHAEDTIVSYLKRVESQNKSYVVKEGTEGCQRAELAYRVLCSSDTYHLLEVDLFTGRHHQIRVQLSSIGSPIKGDVKYGFPRPNPDGSIHLHARLIEFIHPVKKEKMTICADPPDEKLWNLLLKSIPEKDRNLSTFDC
jgi:23S rRNA pseudouridine1911/1915/1917 synthase